MKKDVYEKVEEGLTLIKEGNDRGVNILFIAMSKAMLIVAKGIVKDSFLAEDIVQESFIKVVNIAPIISNVTIIVKTISITPNLKIFLDFDCFFITYSPVINVFI